MATVAIIPARGGSKGIPRKNLLKLCGRPLVAWSIRQARAAAGIDSVWVSSDSEEILAVAESEGAGAIRRPEALSGDLASSESAWAHALDAIEARGVAVGRIVGMQATSPIREPADLEAALAAFDTNGWDSLLSVCEVEDFFMWRYGASGAPEPVNYDYRNRRMRQQIEPRYLENGSFYVFRPRILREHGNRIGGKIGLFVMARQKMFQIDTPDDAVLCAAIMRGYGYDRV